MIDFYYSPTPNGWKVAIMLEECGLDYHTVLLQLQKGDQFTPEFLEINPAGQTPAIIDHDVDGDPVPVFDSVAILLYLARKTGRLAPSASSMSAAAEQWQLLQWLFWHAGNQSPAAGQLSHFVNYAPADHEYGRRHYTNEYMRNLAVLEKRLQNREYILGEYSIADIACFPWVFIARPLGVDLSRYPAVQAWRGDIKSRPAVQRAIDLHKDQQPVHKHKRESHTPAFEYDGSQGSRMAPGCDAELGREQALRA